jgi:nitrous oxidase accessory protein NosD
MSRLGMLVRRGAPALGVLVVVCTPAAWSRPASDQLCVGGGSGCLATLQAAIDAAKAGDAIAIQAGAFAGGVTIDKSLTLTGAGAARTVVKGGGPVITIAASARTVTLAGLTITGGVTTTDPAGTCGADVPKCGPGYLDATALGGGIEIARGAAVTIENSVVRRNRATPRRTVASVTATCKHHPCSFAQAGGGGIDSWGTLTLIDTTISDNLAGGDRTAQADGGGILSETGSRLILANSTVKGNRASGSAADGRYAIGGGIYLDSAGELDVHGSTVSGNRAEGAFTKPDFEVSVHAGGIWVGAKSVAAIRDTVISGNAVIGSNTAGSGGFYGAGIAADTSTSFTLSGSTVTSNRVVGSVRAASPDFAAFIASSAALDFYAVGRVRIVNTRIVGNSVRGSTVEGPALVNPGAVSAIGPDVVITNSVISRNRSLALSVKGSATAYGGGIGNSGTLTLRRSTVTGNTVSARGPNPVVQGGGVWSGHVSYAGGPVHLKLVHNVIARNAPDQCHGC